MLEVAKIATAALGVFSIGGGIIGFKKAKSKPSLIAGTVSGIALGLCFAVAQNDAKGGLTAALVITVLLDIVFGMRLAKTKKMMPAGMMLVLSLITGGLIVSALK